MLAVALEALCTVVLVGTVFVFLGDASAAGWPKNLPCAGGGRDDDEVICRRHEAQKAKQIEAEEVLVSLD